MVWTGARNAGGEETDCRDGAAQGPYSVPQSGSLRALTQVNVDDVTGESQDPSD